MTGHEAHEVWCPRCRRYLPLETGIAGGAFLRAHIASDHSAEQACP